MRLMIERAAGDDAGELVVQTVRGGDGWRVHILWPDAEGHTGIETEPFKRSGAARNAARRLAVAEAEKGTRVVLVVDS